LQIHKNFRACFCATLIIVNPPDKGAQVYGVAVNGTALLCAEKRKEGVIMRVSQHSGRGQGSTKHNDRSFMQDMKNTYKERKDGFYDVAKDRYKEVHPEYSDNKIRQVSDEALWRVICKKSEIDASHINPDEENNYFWNWTQTDISFEESEKLFYEINYSADLERKNAAYKKKGHPEHIRTIDDVLKSKKTQPEELIISIGKMNDTVKFDVARKCFGEYIKELNDWNKENGNHMKILNLALHRDEKGVDHIHLRRVWDYTDENGNLVLNQNKALELCGIEPPKPSQKIGKYNNRKMTFDAMMREKWLDICEKNGIEVEREPVKDARHKSVKEYKREQQLKSVSTELKNDIANFLKSTMSDFRIMSGLDKKHKNNPDIVKANKRFIENANSFFKLLEDKYNMPIHTKAPEDDDLLKNENWLYLSEAAKEDIEFDKILSEVFH